MRLWTGSALVQIMACRLFGAKPLSKPMLRYCQLDTKEQSSVKFQSKCQVFHSWKCIWKYRLRNGSHLIQGEMSWYGFLRQLFSWLVGPLPGDQNRFGNLKIDHGYVWKCVRPSGFVLESLSSPTLLISTFKLLMEIEPKRILVWSVN